MKLIDIDLFDDRKTQQYANNNWLSLDDDVIDIMIQYGEVDAIPIDYVKSWIKEHKEYFEVRYVKYMLSDWQIFNQGKQTIFRKENGR